MRVRKRLKHIGKPVKDTQWSIELPIMREAKDIHSKRCEADPIYQILLFPNEVLPVYNEHTGDLLYTTTFIDRVLSGIKAMLEKRYGDALSQETLVTDMFKGLSSPQCDTRIKIFVLMFLIKWEPSVCELIRDLYDPEATGCLHGEDSLKQYNTLLKLLDKWVAQTVVYPFSQLSIVEIVTSFVDACTQEYIMGPFQ